MKGKTNKTISKSLEASDKGNFAAYRRHLKSSQGARSEVDHFVRFTFEQHDELLAKAVEVGKANNRDITFKDLPFSRTARFEVQASTLKFAWPLSRNAFTEYHPILGAGPPEGGIRESGMRWKPTKHAMPCLWMAWDQVTQVTFSHPPDRR